MTTTRTDLIIHNRMTGAITQNGMTARQYAKHNDGTIQPVIFDGEQCWKLLTRDGEWIATLQYDY